MAVPVVMRWRGEQESYRLGRRKRTPLANAHQCSRRTPSTSVIFCSTFDLDEMLRVPASSRQICNAARTAAARPTLDDVERIAAGKPSRRRGVGSRAVPHRLNAAEVRAFQRAKQQGFVQLHGSGNRRERAGSPLANTFRNWCDANAVPSVALYRRLDEGDDTVVADLSTLRQTTEELKRHAARCIEEVAASGQVYSDAWEQHEEQDCWMLPIHQMASYPITWTQPRAEAKGLAANLVAYFEVPTGKYK